MLPGIIFLYRDEDATMFLLTNISLKKLMKDKIPYH